MNGGLIFAYFKSFNRGFSILLPPKPGHQSIDLKFRNHSFNQYSSRQDRQQTNITQKIIIVSSFSPLHLPKNMTKMTTLSNIQSRNPLTLSNNPGNQNTQNKIKIKSPKKLLFRNRFFHCL